MHAEIARKVNFNDTKVIDIDVRALKNPVPPRRGLRKIPRHKLGGLALGC
jgi:hypothetical protein